MKKTLLILSILTLFYSCSFLEEDDEVIYMEYDGAYLPIYSRGNKSSENVILWTHGGPGSSGMYYGDIDEISVLHDDFHIIYWDQLSSGGSLGDPDIEDYTVENFANHLEGVVNVVKSRYNPENFYLLGHSWGGYLASWYLAADSSREDDFKGLVLLNPILDIPRALTTSIEYIMDYAADEIDAGNDVDMWTEALEWYDDTVEVHGDNYVVYGEDVATHYDYIEEAGGMLKNGDRNDELELELGLEMTLFSPFHFYNYYSNQSNIRTYLQIEDASLDNEDHNTDAKLENITLPVLFIAGVDDKIADIEMSTDWSGQFSTPSSSVYFEAYDDCCHAAFLDQATLFQDDVRTFCTSY